MQEVNFKDRIPRNPGRVVLTPVAGAVNTFDIVRADDPTEKGTPLNKATFDSIIHSRLVGRYYHTTVTQIPGETNVFTVNPVPTSGWLNATRQTANLNGYELYSTAASSQSEMITAAFDGNANTFWRGNSTAESYIGFKLPTPLNVSKLRAKFSFTSGDTNTAKIQASNNWTTWVDVSAPFTVGRGATNEISLNTTEAFYYYRVLIDIYLETGTDCYFFEIAEYSVTSGGKNSFAVADVPTEFSLNQRLLIITPATGSFSTVGVASNDLNGIALGTILQPNKLYELIYNGSRFNVMEA